MDFAGDWSAHAIRLRETLGIEDDWLYRYASLSGGQAKRVQVACALAAEPDVLILDEPTNHVDAHTRAQILCAMQEFRGVGIVIAHDLDLLDAVCTHTLSFERMRVDGAIHTEVIMRAGNASDSRAVAEREEKEHRKELERSRAEVKRLRAVHAQRQEKVRQAARDANKPVDRKDHDACKAKKYAKGGKDAGVARAASRIGAQLRRAKQASQDIATRAKHYSGDFWVQQEASHVHEVVHMDAGWIVPGDVQVHDSPDNIAGRGIGEDHCSTLGIHGKQWKLIADGEMGSVQAIHIPSISLGPHDHVALTGNNGMGKSTVLRSLCAHINPHLHALVIEQDAGDPLQVIDTLRFLPQEQRSQVLHAYAQLNADPDKLLQSRSCSPGELRKLMLALATVSQVQVIVMDEPTNHLDLDSRHALARVLADFPGTLVLVSHDRTFLDEVMGDNQ